MEEELQDDLDDMIHVVEPLIDLIQSPGRRIQSDGGSYSYGRFK